MERSITSSANDPDRPRLVASTDYEAAEADMGPMDPENPIAIARIFITALHGPEGPLVDVLRAVVTPESLPAWGDFRDAAEALEGCGMTSRVSPSDDPAVVYAKYVTDHDGVTYQVQGGDMVLMVRAVATLVHRPEHGGWLIHGVGMPLQPEEVPH
ncbi:MULTISPECIES: hypothetical protein [unclassified Amycolatopsis]|uniref:hypothetical protein n=1 Tax=unclassified Amycolatopsis TaxID=2618356 RepID=UPI002874C2CE|nr:MULTISPECIES: hypothetical protein [unclassified Amycolatopsis]MDS0137561.1 hypothetical protein [Amycolatopsis sp. 505]MDS0141756.1 hypothetical protein [Amycolatopsis sp. CM201R]